MPRQPSDDWWTQQGYAPDHPLFSQQRDEPDFQVEEDFQEGADDGNDGVPVIPFTVYPTATSNRFRPRTIAAGYDRDTHTLRIRFRPGASKDSPAGAIYDYHDVTPREWYDIRRVVSTGKFINRRLAGKEYTRIE